MSMVKEFREFISKGNVLDLAVGVIIGASFGKIISSLVDDIIMPPIGYLLGGVDFADLKYTLVPADAANKVAEVSVKYGNFINTVIQFLIIAICIFAIVKSINSLKRKEEAAPEVAHVPTREENLLADIRDILKTQQR
jgi:large conductance mechanosensitive channel